MKKGLKRFLSSVLAATMAVSGVMLTQIGSVAVGAAGITAESAGWHEVAYTEWLPVTGAASYEAYVKASSASQWTKLDDQLIRQYNTYCRADALGLAAGTYNMKIVAKNGAGGELGTYESGSITVDNYDRSGFAFSSNSPSKSASGGYNDDGTPKSGARIVYVTDANKDTITLDIVKDSKGTKETATGLGAIIKLLDNGCETRPIIFRFIGQVTAPIREQKLNQLDIKRSVTPLTFEGVGPDTVIKYGFNVVTSNNIEFRNMGFKDMTTKDEDGVTITEGCTNIWVHHNDFFYGGKGSDKDQAKGDGSVDIKGTTDYVTVSDNHYWDSGKVNLCGLKESTDYHITYSRNWFDHSDSRHPRVRRGSVHVYNNYYDGVSKYGPGATSGSSLFVDSNYFRDTKDPVLSSKQGTDALGSGTFSGETGGIIKMYGNIMTGNYNYIEGNTASGYNPDSDGYTVQNRKDTIPDSVKTVSGGTSYNNFDTTMDLGLSKSKLGVGGILEAKDVPAYVVANAGRINMGNFRFDFSNSEDTNYDVIPELTEQLGSYNTTIVNYGGKVTKQPNTSAAKESTLGVDGNTAYEEKLQHYQDTVKNLPTQTEAPSGGSGGEGGGTTPAPAGFDLVLNGKTDIPAGTYSSSKKAEAGYGTNGFAKLVTNTADTVVVNSNKGIQLGGGGDFAIGKRLISVYSGKAGTIYVTGSSTSTDTRTINILNSTGRVIGTIATGSSAGVKLPEAGTYYVCSLTKGINISRVAIAYDSDGKEPSTQPTTASQSTQTTTKEPTPQGTTKEPDTENSTSAPPVDMGDYAAEGTYVIGSNASGGDYNITQKEEIQGNVDFEFRNMKDTGGNVRSFEEGGYVGFELGAAADITIKVGSGKDIVIRENSETNIVATFKAGAENTAMIPAGSYVIESSDSGSNAEMDKLIIKYLGEADVNVKGDADNDNSVTKNDVEHILDYLTGAVKAVANKISADVNEDGVVNGKDAYEIAKNLVQ